MRAGDEIVARQLEKVGKIGFGEEDAIIGVLGLILSFEVNGLVFVKKLCNAHFAIFDKCAIELIQPTLGSDSEGLDEL